MLKNSPKCDVSTACSMSASFRMMLGLFPPHSRVTLFRLDAASAWMSLPTSVDPVKATLSSWGWREMAAPAVGPYLAVGVGGGGGGWGQTKEVLNHYHIFPTKDLPRQ